MNGAFRAHIFPSLDHDLEEKKIFIMFLYVDNLIIYAFKWIQVNKETHYGVYADLSIRGLNKHYNNNNNNNDA